MTDVYWPEDLIPSRTSITVQDSVGRFTSPITGFTRTIGRPGSRLKMSMSFQYLNDRKRALLQAAIAASRGGARAYVCRDHSYKQTDFHSWAELLPTTTFANGSTATANGFTISGSWSSSLKDRVLRLTRAQNTAAAVGMVRTTDPITVTQYQPYAFRAVVLPGRGPYTALRLNIGSSAFASDYHLAQGLSAGLLATSFVPYVTSIHASLGQGIVSGALAGDDLFVPYTSLAPCAQVDNAPNIIPFSVDLANAAWNQGARITVPTTSVTLPDGSTGTTNTLAEDGTAANSHFLGDNITVTTTLGDWCLAGAFKAANRTWVQIRIQDVTAGAAAQANLNLSTGALGTVGGTSPTWLNARAFVVSLGDGWYYFALIARNTTSNTNIGPRIFIGESDNDVTFSGSTQDSIYCWRPSLAQSGVPIRLSATTGTAVETGTLQNLGGGIYTKGWTASTIELLKRGGQVQIGTQLLITEAPINTDAAGRAFLPIPSLRAAPADGAPVMIVDPLGRFIPEESENGWTNVPGIFSDSELVLGEIA